MPENQVRTDPDMRTDAAGVRMLEAFAGGQFCPVELYPERTFAAHVSRFGVYKMGPGEFRAQVLFVRGYDQGPRLVGMDGSRDDCARWMRVHGVPVLRIGSPAKS